LSWASQASVARATSSAAGGISANAATCSPCDSRFTPRRSRWQ
jgi:hypothetical protein